MTREKVFRKWRESVAPVQQWLGQNYIDYTSMALKDARHGHAADGQPVLLILIHAGNTLSWTSALDTSLPIHPLIFFSDKGKIDCSAICPLKNSPRYLLPQEVTNTVLQILHWFPVSFRVQFKVLVITFKVLYGLGLGYLKNCLLR